LVGGDVEGNFDQLFSRIRSIQKKSGNFDLLLCVGDFFGTNFTAWESYSKGDKEVPIATLILGPNKFEHTDYYKDKDGGDLCDNVTYLGKKGTYNGSSGLTIAYLSGTESSDGKSGEIHFSQQDVSSLLLPIATDNKFLPLTASNFKITVFVLLESK
jgi:hypothetical protein